MEFIIWFGFGLLGSLLFFLGGVFMCQSYEELKKMFMEGVMIILYVFGVLLGIFSFMFGAAFLILMFCKYFSEHFVLKKDFGKSFFDKVYSILYKDKE